LLTAYKIFTTIIYYLALPVTWLIHTAGSRKWSQRLGYNHRPCPDGDCDVWMHASSMGEVKVLGILREQLRKIKPDLSIYITVMTDAGYGSASKLKDELTAIGFLPLDSAPPINRFFKSVNPQRAVFIETEIWPNIITELGRKNIPVFLANGRLSEKAMHQYKKFRSGLKKVFANYSCMMVQSDGDRKRYETIGADKNIIEIFGNLKFDAPMKMIDETKKVDIKKSLPFGDDSRLFIAGSTRNGENEILIHVFKELSREFTDLRMIIVPRHLERVAAVKQLCDNSRLHSRLYSERDDGPDEPQILIVDKMGILNDLYAVSDIAFVGGTLVEIGGQNILEPVWAGIPVLFGPSIFNVLDSAAYITAGNYGAMVDDSEDLKNHLADIFNGKITYEKKRADDDCTSHAYRTALKIMGQLIKDGKTVAENNSQ